jgi:hypothetical protein
MGAMLNRVLHHGKQNENRDTWRTSLFHWYCLGPLAWAGILVSYVSLRAGLEHVACRFQSCAVRCIYWGPEPSLNRLCGPCVACYLLDIQPILCDPFMKPDQWIFLSETTSYNLCNHNSGLNLTSEYIARALLIITRLSVKQVHILLYIFC